MKEIRYHKNWRKKSHAYRPFFGVKFCRNKKINMHFVAYTLFMGKFWQISNFLKNIQHISTKLHVFEICQNFPIKRVYATKMYLFSHLCKISHHKRSVGIGFLSSILWYWKFSNLSPNNYKKLVKFKLAKKLK